MFSHPILKAMTTEINLKVEKEELESLKTSLDMSASYWRREAEKETDQRHKVTFQELQQKYTNLYEKVKTYLK